ncbi:MAG: hypothetical protein J2P13_06775, partial [Acidobacteria bacterium]|nr:hypothetical protein [Acidobacteriota bacterium]
MRSILEQEETTIDLEHINVKLLLKDSIDLDPIIPIFHNWIQSRVLPELLIDVADYRHVHHGPGIVLIGHEADYSIDQSDGRLGLRYNRKAPLSGTNQEKLSQALCAALASAKHLQEDTRLNNKFHFNGREIDLVINDRLLAPNDEKTRLALDPDLRSCANKLLAGAPFSLHYETDPR